jgi:hypothetical protein
MPDREHIPLRIAACKDWPVANGGSLPQAVALRKERKTEPRLFNHPYGTSANIPLIDVSRAPCARHLCALSR